MCGTPKAGAYLDGRCGYGPRQPLLVISPFARTNSVDHSITDQSSILRFVEDNWNTGRIGNQSFDAIAGSLDNMFNFRHDDGAGSCSSTRTPGSRHTGNRLNLTSGAAPARPPRSIR